LLIKELKKLNVVCQIAPVPRYRCKKKEEEEEKKKKKHKKKNKTKKKRWWWWWWWRWKRASVTHSVSGAYRP
jgi:hypothetical protein